MKKNKNVRQDNLSSVDENKRIYKMYKSKKTWVVAPVVLGALAAGLATAPVAHADEATTETTEQTPAPKTDKEIQAEESAKAFQTAKDEAKAKLTVLVDKASTFKTFAKEAGDKVDAAKTTAEIEAAMTTAYNKFEEVYTDLFATDFYKTIDGLNLTNAKKDAYKATIRTALNGDYDFSTNAKASLTTAIDQLTAIINAENAQKTAQTVVNEAIKEDLDAYKAIKLAEINEMPFLSATEKEAYARELADDGNLDGVNNTVLRAQSANDTTKASLTNPVQAIIDQITDQDKKAELQDTLDKANTKEAIEAAKTAAQAALDAQNVATDLAGKKAALTEKIATDAEYYHVKDADKDAWTKKVADAKTATEVDQIEKDWNAILIDLAKNAFDVAYNEVQAMQYILPTSQANILRSMDVHRDDVTVVKSLLEEARKQDAAEKQVVLAAIEAAKTEIAGLNLSKEDKEYYGEELDKVTSVIKVNEILNDAKDASKANDLADYKTEAKKSIDKLEYINKDYFHNAIDDASVDTIAKVDAVVAQANKDNFYQGVKYEQDLTKQKEIAKNAIEALSDLTEAQKAQYKNDVEKVKTTTEVSNIYYAAGILNDKQKADNDAIQALKDAKEAAKKTIDALPELSQASKDAYKAQIDEAKDEAKVNEIVADAQQQNQEIAQAKAELENAKSVAVGEIKDKEYLSDKEKSDLIGEVYAANSKEAVANVVAKAEKLAADNELKQADKAKAKTIIEEKINGMTSLSEAEKIAYINRLEKADTKETMIDIYNEAAAMDTKHHDHSLINDIDKALKDKEYAQAQNLIDQLRDDATKAKKQAELDAEKALSAAKASAYKTVDALTEFTPEEKAAERAKISKMTDPKEIADYAASLVKKDDALHDAPWVALAEKLIKQGDMEGAKKAIAKVRDTDEKARLTAMLGLDGWSQVDGKWYYYNKGEMVKGWFLEEKSGNWFYLDPTTGAMHTGLVDINGATFYFGPLGNMYKGWVNVDGTWYFFHTELGNAQKGWTIVGNNWYFFNNKGEMQTGLYTDAAGQVFYLQESGAMAENWSLIDGKWRHSKANGALEFGWFLVNNIWYYGGAEGVILTNTTQVINGVSYTFDANGAWIA